MKERGRLGQNKITRDKKSEFSSGLLLFHFKIVVYSVRDVGKHCYKTSSILITYKFMK